MCSTPLSSTRCSPTSHPKWWSSLLTTLPKWGPKRAKDFEPARKLWGRGAPNLVAAAQRAGVRRVVAESVVFAYGYPTSGPPLMDETDPYPGPPLPGGERLLRRCAAWNRPC